MFHLEPVQRWDHPTDTQAPHQLNQAIKAHELLYMLLIIVAVLMSLSQLAGSTFLCSSVFNFIKVAEYGK